MGKCQGSVLLGAASGCQRRAGPPVPMMSGRDNSVDGGRNGIAWWRNVMVAHPSLRADPAGGRRPGMLRCDLLNGCIASLSDLDQEPFRQEIGAFSIKRVPRLVAEQRCPANPPKEVPMRMPAAPYGWSCRTYQQIRQITRERR